MMELIHLGGVRTVTGSCHLLRLNGVNVLVQETIPAAIDQLSGLKIITTYR